MTAEKHEVLLRMRAIELLAYWEGRLVTNQLMAWFGVSRQQASADIKRYISNHNADSLIHDPSVKAYVPTPGFQPVLTDGHINEYMNMTAGFAGEPMLVTLETDAHLSAIQLPDRAVRPEVVREVIKACRSGSSIKVIYASMSNPSWHERVISPHTMVYTGFRWHVRAFCHTRQEFRDFRLSRFDRTPQTAADIQAPVTGLDSDWHNTITLTLVPNRYLNAGQQALVEKDYGMPDGRLQLTVRKALANYVLQRYQAAITEEEAGKEKQYPLQLVEADRKSLRPSAGRPSS